MPGQLDTTRVSGLSGPRRARLALREQLRSEWLQNVSRETAGELLVSANETVRGHMKSILDPSFRYTASFSTDLQKTFARIRHNHRKDARMAAQATAEAFAKVSSIVGKTATGR